jgi:hypothetical protein
MCEQTVEHLRHRSDELVSVHVRKTERLHARMGEQGRVILALDGLPPDVGHEVLWVVREVLSGEIVLARALLSASQEDLAALLTEANALLPESVPVSGITPDGHLSIRRAVASTRAGVPHHRCHVPSLREAARPISDADRHAKKERKKRVREIRPRERSLEGQTDEEAQVVRDSCLAARSALTDDGQPPLRASGVRFQERVYQISDSIERVAQTRGCLGPLSACNEA